MPDGFAGATQGVEMMDALGERYLAYALSTIMARSLPDVRDGMKPVHRRVLYGMLQLKLDPASGFKKCARVVGDVMGKFHPHGDSSIYEALVRLAQDFSVRYPLVEGQGNFGNIDGDNPAAMRYTEARMTEMALSLIEGISEDAVDFQPTYDGNEAEPVVMPAGFPNILANGAAGIAVGMATSIPPHNVGELCAAAAHLIRHPEATTRDLLAFVPGPDFPTGGVIAEDPEAVALAYETGRGGFRIRAKWAVEHGKNGTWQIVVTEIPYQVQKSRLVEQLADLLEQKKLPLLGDVRDESSETIRLVLEPRARTVSPAALMESVFQATPLESRFPLNMNVLGADRTPGVLSLRDMLRAWLDHRQVVLVRRSRHRLAAVERRLEILDGFLSVYANLDEAIRIVRDADDAKAALMERFSINDTQAEAILNMRLRSLRRLEEQDLRREHAGLTEEGHGLRALLASDGMQWDRILADTQATGTRFGAALLGARRSEMTGVPSPVETAETNPVEREALTVILSEKGWIRAVRGAVADPQELKFKEADHLRVILPCDSADRVCLFTQQGKVFTLKAGDLPRGRGDGQALRLLVEMAPHDEVHSVFLWRAGQRYLLASDAGYGFIAKADDLLAEKRTGKQVLVLKEGQRPMACRPAQGDHVAVIGESRKMVVFPLDQIPELSKGIGVLLQKYRDGRMLDLTIFTYAEGLSWKQGDKTRTEGPEALRAWLVARGSVGRLPPHGFPRSGKFE